MDNTTSTTSTASIAAWEQHHITVFGSSKVAEEVEARGTLVAALTYLDRFERFDAATPVQPLANVVRKYRCPDCGYRHTDGVEVTLDSEGGVTAPCVITGYWCCDECGSDFFENVRVVRKDFVA